MARPPEDKNRKEKLIEIAIKLLAADGFANMSFQKIADKAKVSQSTVIHYFPNKNELLAEISGHVAKVNRYYVESFENPADDADERLRKFIHNNFNWAEKYPEYAQIIVLLSFLAIQNKDFKDLYKQRLQSVRKKLVEILHAGLRESKFDFPVAQIDNLAALMHNFLVAAITNYLATGDAEEKKKSPQKIQLLFNGLLGAQSKPKLKRA